MTEPTVDTVIASYIKMRNEKQQKDATHKAEMKVYDDRLKKLEAWLQAKMLAENLKALPTEAGTAYITQIEQATVADMNALLDYVRENNAWHLLEKRVSKTGIRELLDADQPLPPGVNWFTATAVNIRKPSER